jgi:hypothetical protein
MKFAILVLTIIGSVSAFADTPCQKKQIEAAKKAMAKDYGVMKKYIMYSGFEPGFWTELVGENIRRSAATIMGSICNGYCPQNARGIWCGDKRVTKVCTQTR